MNLDDLQRQVRWRLVLFLVGLSLVLFILDSTGNLDNTFSFLQDPINAVVSWTSSRVDAFATVFAGPRDLQEARSELAALQARVDELERENEQLREIQGEYQLLQDLFNRNRETPAYNRVLANVIGRDTSPFFRSIIIDKGRDDGVRVGMPVESARGLVGQVYRTADRSAQVLLLTDNLSSIPTRLIDTRAVGVTHGSTLGGLMTMDWISLEADVAIGEVVMTSGLGGRFPPDIVVGRVTQVQKREAALFQSATVQPAVDFDRLELVFVVISFTPIDTSIFDEPEGN